ncbi:hypothetical protein A9Z06_13840 [Rhizobium sp. YK2]|nr:hypothetical protein A9Z06_13840 [Rhizobium sp. YK2]
MAVSPWFALPMVTIKRPEDSQRKCQGICRGDCTRGAKRMRSGAGWEEFASRGMTSVRGNSSMRRLLSDWPVAMSHQLEATQSRKIRPALRFRLNPFNGNISLAGAIRQQQYSG